MQEGRQQLCHIRFAPLLDSVVTDAAISDLHKSYKQDKQNDPGFTTLNTERVPTGLTPMPEVQPAKEVKPSDLTLSPKPCDITQSPFYNITFPSRSTFTECDLLNQIFFPRFWNCHPMARAENKPLLRDKLMTLACVMFNGIYPYCQDAEKVTAVLAQLFAGFGRLRELIKKDVLAAYQGDPAAKFLAEVIRCYPGLTAVMVQRVAHELYKLNVAVYPRELCELVHRYTAIDIHPGAEIGEYFFIDHGVGTVIGETCVIGSWCRIYQNVTLGALHFEIDSDTKMLRKNYKRHPTIGHNVVIGTGAKLLGPLTVGDHVSIGANSWVQEDIPSYTSVFIQQHPAQAKKVRKDA
eukprot:TRINITY_DN5863_c0_g1_i1.p1 TRINITY_DN5863_c0_g1~~TRINITY_DN5863_c0_g1_i1.p1  ORF type:complete len:398 (+),score=120.84 TRINITY_DN5863_c0_g1_i1:144-1196(+)